MIDWNFIAILAYGVVMALILLKVLIVILVGKGGEE